MGNISDFLREPPRSFRVGSLLLQPYLLLNPNLAELHSSYITFLACTLMGHLFSCLQAFVYAVSSIGDPSCNTSNHPLRFLQMPVYRFLRSCGDFSGHVDQFILCPPTRLTVISRAASFLWLLVKSSCGPTVFFVDL